MHILPPPPPRDLSGRLMMQELVVQHQTDGAFYHHLLFLFHSQMSKVTIFFLKYLIKSEEERLIYNEVEIL